MYMPKPPYNPKNERLETLVDDHLERQDATHRAQHEGLSMGYDARKDALAHPMIRYSGKYGEFVLEGDLYSDPEGGIMLHVYCPVCSTSEKPHNLCIKSRNKKMSYDKDRGVSVETFACTWELPEADERKMEFGMGLCKWRVVIDNNTARDV